MSQIINIESNPISSSGICYVGSGSTVTFYVNSGITSGTSVSYQWYRNDVLVSIGAEYTLLSPEQGDEIHVKIVNCGCSCGPEDVDFITTTGFYYIDVQASTSYQIQSIIFQSFTTESNITVSINGTDIVWTGGITELDISPGITEFKSLSNNFVYEGDFVTIFSDGDLRAKLKIRRF